MENLALDKKQVERQFERAAESYDSAATLQRDIIHTLISHLSDVLLDQPENIFSPKAIADLGCGTGQGLVELSKQFPNSSLTGVDISQAMLDRAAIACPQARLLKADMEQLPSASEAFDLIFTSSSLQWCQLDNAVTECARTLAPNGYFAMATFGPKTQIEWKAAWAKADGHSHTLDYPALNEIESCLKKNGILSIKSASEIRTLDFDSTKEVLKSVKLLGATNAKHDRHRGLMGKERFGRFLKAFEQQSRSRSLTYEVFYVVGQSQGAQEVLPS